MAIAAGTAELCAPKSMTLNLKEMLSGAALGGKLDLVKSSPGHVLTLNIVDRYYCHWRVCHYHSLCGGIVRAGQQWKVGPLRGLGLRQGESHLFIEFQWVLPTFRPQFGKPMYSTRIILGDLNPVWEETAVMLVTMDEVRSKEDLSAMLWDSDKRSAE